MRSTSSRAMLLGTLLLAGLLLGALPAPARADRPAPGLRADPVNPGPPPDVARALPGMADRPRGCGTPEVTPGEAEAVRMALRRWGDENAGRPSGGTIRIAFHVITSHGEGNVSQDRIAEQIRELNRDYAGTGYRFELTSVDRTENPAWFKMTPGSGKERQAKQALAIDPTHHLNLYTCGPGQSLLGWAYFPWSAPESHYIHGVVVDHASLPGGQAPFDLGRTATHEIGHYLGLLHTFQGGCSAPGDEVDDTPFEASPAFGCLVGRNTCPSPGDDPIHNYMDYSDDACYTEFTAGQRERIQAIVPVYRPSLFSELVARAASQPEIVPGAGAEPEEGRVLAYRGAFPNPFYAETALRFTLPASAEVSLRIYSVTGQLVRSLVDAQLPPGDHSAMFRAGELPSGAYFAVLKVGRVQMSRTMVLVR
jgi:hypothetical protein